MLGMVLAAASAAYPMRTPVDAWHRARFVASAIRHRRLIRSWLEAPGVGGLLSVLRDHHPHMIGIVEWPYLHKDWDVTRRFDAVRGHYVEVERLAWLQVALDEARLVSDLGAVVPGLRVVLDRPKWFMREGELTLNLFLGDERIYSLAFLLGRSQGVRTAFIGAVQGRDLEGIEATYRNLTRKLHGARPRDCLLTVLQMVCGAAGVQRVLAVAEDCRHHLHPYFRGKGNFHPSADYDVIWTDRGGHRVAGGFFELPVTAARRAEAEIPSRKRAMYRRRYSMYDEIQADVERLAGLWLAGELEESRGLKAPA